MKTYTYIGGDAYSAPCVALRQGSSTRYYYLIRDHLGSIIEISDSTDTKLYEYSYDAWGRMRNPSNWVNYAPGSEPSLFIGRGFTGHEHLPWFNLINMNGRVYDALCGMFLSPDNNIQAPDFTQNFNRYGYCLNNPLKYSDLNGQRYNDFSYSYEARFSGNYNENWASWVQGTRNGGMGARFENNVRTYYAAKEVVNNMNFLWNSTILGGSWSFTSGIIRYESFSQAVIEGCLTNQRYGYWGCIDGAAKSWAEAISNAKNSISMQSMTASNSGGGRNPAFDDLNSQLQALQQYFALVAGECGGDKKSFEEAQGIGSVIRNILSHTKQDFDGDLLSKLRGPNYFQAAKDGGNDPYRAIMSSSFDEIFSSKNIYNQSISGAFSVFCTNKDYSSGGYFFSSGIVPTDGNWKRFNDCTYSITTQIGKFTFFKYSNSDQHWP